MLTGILPGLRRIALMLAGAVMLAVLLPAGVAFATVPSHDPSSHAAHRHGTRPMGAVQGVQSLTATDSAAPCHHGAGGALPSCCVGAACVAMHVGLANPGGIPSCVPNAVADRPASGALPDGVGVPPALPPPRLG